MACYTGNPFIQERFIQMRGFVQSDHPPPLQSITDRHTNNIANFSCSYNVGVVPRSKSVKYEEGLWELTDRRLHTIVDNEERCQCSDQQRQTLHIVDRPRQHTSSLLQRHTPVLPFNLLMLHVGTGDHWRKSANCGYLTLSAAVYQRQLSVPSLRGLLMSISESWGVNGHTTRCTGPVSVVTRLRLVSGWGLRKRRSAPPHGP